MPSEHGFIWKKGDARESGKWRKVKRSGGGDAGRGGRRGWVLPGPAALTQASPGSFFWGPGIVGGSPVLSWRGALRGGAWSGSGHLVRGPDGRRG